MAARQIGGQLGIHGRSFLGRQLGGQLGVPSDDRSEGRSEFVLSTYSEGSEDSSGSMVGLQL